MELFFHQPPLHVNRQCSSEDPLYRSSVPILRSSVGISTEPPKTTDYVLRGAKIYQQFSVDPNKKKKQHKKRRSKMVSYWNDSSCYWRHTHAIVKDLLDFGAAVHTCSRTESDLNNCLKEWQSQGFSVTGSVCDVSSKSQRENLIQQVSSTFNGKLNIFVNNVGTNFRKPTIEYTSEEYSELMRVNLESAFHLWQLAYPLLKASGTGSIVFISSVAGVVSLGTGSVYAACKAAMNQLTKNLACEWAIDNIRSDCVVPWATRTHL